jgi:hypothetical protein
MENLEENKDIYDNILNISYQNNKIIDSRNNKELKKLDDNLYINLSLENDKIKKVLDGDELKEGDILQLYNRKKYILDIYKYCKIIKVHKKMITYQEIKPFIKHPYYNNSLKLTIYEEHFYKIDKNQPLKGKPGKISKNNKYINKIYSDTFIYYKYVEY